MQTEQVLYAIILQYCSSNIEETKGKAGLISYYNGGLYPQKIGEILPCTNVKLLLRVKYRPVYLLSNAISAISAISLTVLSDRR